jgi:hypothetical protein
MPNLSRRHLVTTAAALPALAMPAGAIAGTTLALSPEGDGDAVLLRLWSEYVAQAEACAAARAKYEPARALYDAEEPPCPDDVLAGHHWDPNQWLWRKHGLDALSDAWNDACEATGETIEEIRDAEATGLLGILVKFLALPPDTEAEDYEESYVSALTDIDRLFGSGFAGAAYAREAVQS